MSHPYAPLIYLSFAEPGCQLSSDAGGPDLRARGIAFSARPLHALAVFAHVVARDAGIPRAVVGADLVVGPAHGLGVHLRLALERMRLVGVAVVPVERPIQAD